MSSLMDGINNAYAITTQINNLKSLSAEDLQDPKVLEYALEQNFNKMLDGLIASGSDDDDDDDNADYFSFFNTGNQASLQSLQAQGILSESEAQILAGGETGTSTALSGDVNAAYLQALSGLNSLL